MKLREEHPPVITTEDDEVETPSLLITNQPLRRANILHPEKVLVNESGSSGFVVSQVSKARPGAPALSTCQIWGTRPKQNQRIENDARLRKMAFFI
jgi:hypothetical protein